MYGLNIDPNNTQYGNPDANELRALGVQSVRFTYHDETVGEYLSPEKVDFWSTKIDQFVAYGINTLLILSYDTLPGKPTFEAPIEEWAQYIDRFAIRAGQIALNFSTVKEHVSLQIWNEPDLKEPGGGYDPRLKEEVYCLMLNRTCDQIFRAEEAFDIVTAGLASGDPSWWARVTEGDYRAPVDCLAFHPYGQRPQPNWPHPTWGFGYVGDLLKRYQAVWGGRIKITECGEDTTNEPEQATYLSKFFNEIDTLYSPPVEEMFWFCYSDGMVPPFGLVHADSTRKPAYNTYQSVTGPF